VPELTLLFPIQFLVMAVIGWISRRQQRAIDYRLEENRVQREQLGERRPRLIDDQRRRPAVKGKRLGRQIPAALAGIVTPDTILRWYRRLIAQKYDGSGNRGRRRRRPPTANEIAELVVRLADESPG
jgi:hypothetical protein